MRLAILLLAIPLMASQSFVLNSGRRATFVFPGGSPMCANVTSFRVEGHFERMGAATGGNQMIRQDTSWAVILDDAGNLATLTLNTSGGPFVGISGWTYVRWRFQRFTAPAQYALEVWNEEAPGERREVVVADSSPGSFNPAGCNLFIGAQSPAVAPPVAVGAVRIYSGTVPLNSPPPPRLLTGDFAGLINLELEGNLLDSSARGLNGTMSLGSAAYQTTTVLPPVVNVSGPVSVRATQPASFTGSCISNEDDPACTVRWNQVSGPARGEFTNPNTLSPTFRPPQFGQYDLVVAASTSTQSSTRTVILGAAAADSRGAAIIPDASVAAVLGPLVRLGGDQWSWADDRAVAIADNQIAQRLGTNGAQRYWAALWEEDIRAGTVTVTRGSATITGSGTNFQADFCGGGTTPTVAYPNIHIRYEDANYPGQWTWARYAIVSCNSATSITVDFPWGHSDNQSGRAYSRVVEGPPANPATPGGWWYSTSTPGNYYDNVLAFYGAYYRSGLTRYRDAARELARAWWTGPPCSRGRIWDFPSLGGKFGTPPRSQALTGLVLWALESGENIWPGMILAAAGAKANTYDFYVSRAWNVQAGELREVAYAMATFALMARFHPTLSVRNEYMTILRQMVDNYWIPLQNVDGSYRWTSTQSPGFLQAGGGRSVTLANGSTAITANGFTWSAGNFTGTTGPYTAHVWFFTGTDDTMPGANNSDVGGDAQFYRVTNAPTSTTATLDRPYVDTACTPSCNKSIQVSTIIGFGTQPFYMGLAIGAMAQFVRDAFSAAGETAYVAKVDTVVDNALNWLDSPVAYNPTGHYLYGASLFLNCVANPTGPNCEGGILLNAEATRAYSQHYIRTGSPTTLAVGDELYNALWCKPTGGWTCPIPGYDTYADFFDGGIGSFLQPTSPPDNKWWGFTGGFAGGPSWSLSRQGGPQPPDTRTVRLVLGAPAAATSTTVRLIWPSGQSQDITCSAGVCEGQFDARQGEQVVWQARHLAGSDLIAVGREMPLTLQ